MTIAAYAIGFAATNEKKRANHHKIDMTSHLATLDRQDKARHMLQIDVTIMQFLLLPGKILDILDGALYSRV